MLPKRQHYTPVFLLRHFCEDGKLYCIDKKNKKIFRTIPENVSAEKGFYNFTLEGTLMSIEPGFVDIEASTATILARILKERSLHFLSEQDRAMIAVFMAFQFHRTKKTRKNFLKINNVLVDRADEMAKELGKSHSHLRMTEEDAKFAAIKFLAKDAIKHTDYFLDKQWVLFESPKESFYISDEPVVLHNDRKHKFRGNLGLAVKGIQIYFPISPTLTIGFLCQSIVANHRETLATYKSLKRNFPERRYMDKKTVNYLKDTCDAYDSGSPILLKPENVIHLNSLQVNRSDQFVFSAVRNFDLAIEMIDAGHAENRSEIIIE